jgi:ABC-type Na+ efflux pump permease subunit
MLSAVAVALGSVLAGPLVSAYLGAGFRLPVNVFPANHMAVSGLLFVIGGLMNFTFTLALHAVAGNVRRR